jgi:hypothetical protein
MIKNNRLPNEKIYNVFLTIILAFAFLIMIYALTPMKHYGYYLTK